MAARDWLEKDLYKVLGVSETSTKDEIKRAYRKLAQKHHPDANKDDASAEERFKEISEAHAVLSNDEKRKEYDEVRRYAAQGGGPFGFHPGRGGTRVTVGDVGDLGDLFGGAGIGDLFEEAFGFSGRRRRGTDRETEVFLDFEEAVLGSTVELGDGTRVRIPPGVTDGGRIRIAGKGEPGPGGAAPGDLYVRVHVAPHAVFSQSPKGDLIVHLPVTFTEAALGAKVQVPTLDGAVTVKVPPGTRSGKTLRVKGKGVARKNGTGDLLVVIEVEVPQKLSRKEKELLEQFAAVHDADPRKHLEHLIRPSSKEAS
jgi:molecular chaperone DnaJ